MTSQDPDTEELLRRVGRGDTVAVQHLLTRHRERLKAMVAMRMHPRLAARLDPSDVVQEALLDASQKLPGYLRDRPLPFYLWLRRLAFERLVQIHRRHIRARRRSVTREAEEAVELPDQSAMKLADRLVAQGTSPSGKAMWAELRSRVRDALDKLPPGQREVLVLRYLEHLKISEIAAVLGISEGAVHMRHLRAMERLRSLLGNDHWEGE